MIDVQPGQILTGPLFNEPMRVETVQPAATGGFLLGVVGLTTEKFRKVTLDAAQLAQLAVVTSTSDFAGDGALIRLGIQADALGIAYEFDPYFALSISRVDPLPHQLEAVYDYLLKLARVRFLLADDAGAGKTVMAGLLIRELKLRGLAERVMVVCPANLAFQWQRELKEKFDEKFVVMKGSDIREQFGVNQWTDQDRVITSLDLAKRDDILPGLKQARWDLVIVDEAHRMSWSPPAKKTARYALGELLRDSTDHFLLLTATPHKGDPENFSLFLQLLDPDVYAGTASIKDAMNKGRAPFYLRRTKEKMVYFPERQPDGSWKAKPIFTKRIPRTVDFHIDGDEYDLYRAVTKFVKRQSTAAANSDNPQARAVGFLMALFQRRLASSTFSLRSSLTNRATRLEEALKKAIATPIPDDLPDADELDEMDDAEKDKLERQIAAATLTKNADQVRTEIAELRDLAAQAKLVEDAQTETKLCKLKDLLKSEGFFTDQGKRLLIFTEFRDTLDYLVKVLKDDWKFTVGHIHGGMHSGEPVDPQPGTRLHSEQQFKNGDTQILVATEAAGEGINLQCCHVLFNYDIPWNPNRLEQRMGRIHRYGQTEDCLIFNFVATNTIEGSVLQKLLEKLAEIRKALDDDAVFNVVGEVLPAAQIERVLRDYYAGKLGEGDLEDQLLKDVDEGHFRAICQNALEGLASKKLNLNMLIERKAKAQERRVVPETIARVLAEAAARVPFALKPVGQLPHTFDPSKTPHALRTYETAPDWKLPVLADKYPRFTTERDAAKKHSLEWVTPGHPLFEAVRRHAVVLARPDLARGACFYSLRHDDPARIDFYRAKVVDGMGQTVHERMFAVQTTADGTQTPAEPGALGDLVPAKPTPTELPGIAYMQEPLAWIQTNALDAFLKEVADERVAEVKRVADHVELSLKELLHKTDEEIGRAQEAVDERQAGGEGRLAQAHTKYDDLEVRLKRRREELLRQRSLTLQGVERITTVLILPHPERDSPEVKNLKVNPETEKRAMDAVTAFEIANGRVPEDVSLQNLGYDISSLHPASGELRLIEVKGIGAATGTVFLTPNERRVADDRRDCYWFYVVTDCDATPVVKLFKDPARFPWSEVTAVKHYQLSVKAMTPGGNPS